MSSEPDCTASSGGFVLESSLSSIISSHRKGNSNTINSDKISNNNNEDTDCDLEKSVCASSNNNNFNVNNNNLTSATGSVISNGILKNSGTSNNSYATASTNLLNDNSTNSNGKFNTLKCDRCDSFETISHALLLVHVAQCRADINNVNSGTSRQFAIDASNANTESGTDNDGTMDVASVTASSTMLHNSTSDTLQMKQNADGNGNGAAQRKLFECDVCNMKFSNGANMRRHKMRHTGVKPYECRVCQKRFFRKDHLAEHFTTHTKTLPYHCPICNRGFQRQIAMRAHFQNEHVGQNDLVKTCPLCNYRAGTMKSLRIHFFNRHGIDLDNPGPNAPSSLLLALDPTNASNYLPSFALAAAAAAAAANNSSLSLSGNNGGNSNSGPSYSDSGDSLQDSLRSTENGTPPMHFLTPHVEISMADNNDTYKSELMATSMNSTLDIQPTTLSRPLNGGSPSPHSADSNSNMPSSSQSIIGNALQNSRGLHHDGPIKPSISLIPIKQEPSSDDYEMSKSMRQQNADQHNSTSNSLSANEQNATSSSSLTSLIKVSPLKSLLREDLKRRISARATNRATRNSNNSNGNTNNGTSSPANSTASASSPSSFSKNANTVTSIANTINAINQHLLSNSSITVTTESTTTSSGTYNGTAPRSPLGAVATTSNGAITSTGASETELLLAAVSSGHRGKRMLQCQFCGIDFPDQTLYFLHKGCHSDSNAWKCNICGEQCNNVYEFNSHLLSKSHQ